MQLKPFEGFSPEAIAFIDEWRQNNDRNWFQPRKEDFERLIKEPALSFIRELGDKLKLLSRDIQVDLGNNGSLLRFYRDVRFSQDKRPYNPNIRMVFWEGPRKRTDNPGFFIKVDQKGAGVFAGMYMFDKVLLKAFRDAVVDYKLGPQLVTAIETVKKAGDYETGGSFYQRVPRGYDAEHERAEWLKYNGLYAFTTAVSPQEIQSPELVDICFAHCVNIRPVHQWLVDVVAEKL